MTNLGQFRRAVRRRVARFRLAHGGATPSRAFHLPLPDRALRGSTPRSLLLPPPRGSFVIEHLRRHGLRGYEPDTVATFLAVLEHLGRGTVLDIGANVGPYAPLAAALTDWHVVAFEPTPSLARLHRDVAQRNRLHVEVEELALTDEAGKATLHLSSTSDTSNSLVRGFRPTRGTVAVETTTLDRWCWTRALEPAVLKIDVEGSEPAVLRGAHRTLASVRPWIFCEVLANRYERRLEELLGELNYTWYQITDERRFVARREIFGDRAYRFTNWLFAPSPVPPLLFERVHAWRDALARTPTPATRSRLHAVTRRALRVAAG